MSKTGTKRTRWLVAATTAILVLPPANPARAGDPSPSLSPAPASPPGVDQQLDNLSLEIRARLAVSSVFTGMSVDHDTRVIDLYVTDPSDSDVLDTVASASFPIVLHTALASEHTLLVKTESLSPTIDELRDNGITVIRYGPDFHTGALEVVVLNLTQQSAIAVRRAVGYDVVVTNESDAALQGVPTGRSDDYSPWYGADFVTDSGRTGTCTTGFSVHSTNGYDYNMTAGHCFRGGAVAQVGAADTSHGEPYGTHTTMGTITAGNYGSSTNGYLDVEFAKLESGSNLPYVWGPGSSLHPVRGTVQVSPGNTVCTDGAYDGERCGRVDSNGYLQCQVYVDGKKACSTIMVYSTDGLPINGGGDSGGPVYTSTAYPPPTNAYVSAAGIISGASSSTPCVVYKPYRTCYKVAIFTDISEILPRYSVSVKHV